MKNVEEKSKFIENLELRNAHYKGFNSYMLLMNRFNSEFLAAEAKGALISLQESYYHWRGRPGSCL